MQIRKLDTEEADAMLLDLLRVQRFTFKCARTVGRLILSLSALIDLSDVRAPLTHIGLKANPLVIPRY